jgi:hypothetical protein
MQSVVTSPSSLSIYSAIGIGGWFPPAMQRAVWATYRPGQCDDWKPSKEYCEAAKACVLKVADREHRDVNPKDPKVMIYEVFVKRASAQ